MSYGLGPATIEAGAPLPSGRGYAKTDTKHTGCPREGSYVVEIDRFTGATVERCTGCRHRRIIGAYRPSAVVALPEPAGTTVADSDDVVRTCACPCGRPLPDGRGLYFSVECRREVSRLRKAAREDRPAGRLCECGCGVELKPEQAAFASRECYLGSLQAATTARYAAMAPFRATHRVVKCSDCGASFEQHRRAPVTAATRCEPCRVLRKRESGRKYSAGVRARKLAEVTG